MKKNILKTRYPKYQSKTKIVTNRLKNVGITAKCMQMKGGLFIIKATVDKGMFNSKQDAHNAIIKMARSALKANNMSFEYAEDASQPNGLRERVEVNVLTI